MKKGFIAIAALVLLFCVAPLDARIGDHRRERHHRRAERIQDRQDARASRQQSRQVGGMMVTVSYGGQIIEGDRAGWR
jgi:hypothetical protein